MIENTWMFSVFAVYVLSRRGAAHAFDFSTLRNCYWRTFSWWMIGQTWGQLMNMQKIRNEYNSTQQFHIHHRVSQNEATHSILRSMKFHLNTRTMSVWEHDPR